MSARLLSCSVAMASMLAMYLGYERSVDGACYDNGDFKDICDCQTQVCPGCNAPPICSGEFHSCMRDHVLLPDPFGHAVMSHQFPCYDIWQCQITGLSCPQYQWWSISGDATGESSETATAYWAGIQTCTPALILK